LFDSISWVFRRLKKTLAMGIIWTAAIVLIAQRAQFNEFMSSRPAKSELFRSALDEDPESFLKKSGEVALHLLLEDSKS
jgi:hypothetical protein